MSILIPPNTLSNSLNTFSIIEDGGSKKRKVKNEDGSYSELSMSPNAPMPGSLLHMDTFQQLQQHQQQLNSFQNQYTSMSSPTSSNTPSSPTVHSPLLHSDNNYLSFNSGDENSDPLSPLCSFGERDPPFHWNHYQAETWYNTLNTNGEEMPTPQLQIIASKGFSYINNSWVYCRRNHFQLDISATYPKVYPDGTLAQSSSIDPTQTPSYLLIDGQKTPINGLTLTIKGIKNRTEMIQPELEVELFQTNSKREKQGEHAPKPVAVQFGSLVSIQRLHFRKATLNNARRNGQPNPHQEYNQLVVSLWGRCMAQEYCIVSYVSPPLIVRTAISSPSVSPAATDLSPAHTPEQNHPGSPFNSFGSNLSAFPEFSNMRLQSPEGDKTIVYNGSVGINVDNPTFALSVQGTIYASEGVYHPSDLRIKYDVKPVDTKSNLDNVNRMKVYDYKLHPEWVYSCGRDPYDNADRGVIAQEIGAILPGAVRTIGNRTLSGREIENLMVIKNESIVYENVGATQELSKQVDQLKAQLEESETRIQNQYLLIQKNQNMFSIVLILMSLLILYMSL
eukprot:gene18009-21491_t